MPINSGAWAGGYYYLVTVMDDYSRFILAHKLQRDMIGNGRGPSGRQDQAANR